MKNLLGGLYPRGLKNRVVKCRKPPENAVFGPNLR